jgi:hypothetical protein
VRRLKHEAASSRSEGARVDDAQSHSAAVRDTINRRSRAGWPECGFVESSRPIERFDGASGSAIAANAQSARSYEITVRLRDGSSAVFNEASPRTWRLGSRVIVIN